MKLNIQGISIRLRLSQTDLATLERDGRVEETVQLTGGCITYVLEAREPADGLQARLEGTTLIVTLPASEVPPWVASDRVGFESTLPVESGDALRLLVEKDFRCLHKESSESDAFPHPEGQRTA